MELKKCARCGSFYASNENVCGNCAPKENAELIKLKNYFEEEYFSGTTKSKISECTGINFRNLERYLSYDEFNNIYIRDNDSESKYGEGITIV